MAVNPNRAIHHRRRRRRRRWPTTGSTTPKSTTPTRTTTPTSHPNCTALRPPGFFGPSPLCRRAGTGVLAPVRCPALVWQATRHWPAGRPAVPLRAVRGQEEPAAAVGEPGALRQRKGAAPQAVSSISGIPSWRKRAVPAAARATGSRQTQQGILSSWLGARSTCRTMRTRAARAEGRVAVLRRRRCGATPARTTTSGASKRYLGGRTGRRCLPAPARVGGRGRRSPVGPGRWVGRSPGPAASRPHPLRGTRAGTDGLAPPHGRGQLHVSLQRWLRAGRQRRQ